MLKIKKDQTLQIKNFIKNYKNFNEIDLIFQYKNICKDLLFHDEELVVKTIQIVKNNIESWARKNSQVYKELADLDYISKEHLLDKNKWIVDSLKKEAASMRSSGTTGPKFEYYRWSKFLDFLEVENHYNLILEEYKIKKNPIVLYFFNNYGKQSEDFILQTNSKNFMEKHGSKNATTYAVNFSKLKRDLKKFYKNFFEWLGKQEIDVILAPGSDINALCYYSKEFNYNKKICNLLSNTCEKFLQKDVDYLLNNNYINKFCDHMRCWDGGATFTTCREGNYHILDNLSYCLDKEKKLISTDYFSFVSPFVNYWNGDYCQIDSNYKRCDCGRLFRNFKFLDSRPFAVKGESINKIKETIINLEIKGIKRVVCSLNSVDIISKIEFDYEIKNKLINALSNISLRFIVEE